MFTTEPGRQFSMKIAVACASKKLDATLAQSIIDNGRNANLLAVKCGAQHMLIMHLS